MSLNLGSLSIKVTSDGKGITYTLEPSWISALGFLLLLFSPPYSLFMFLSLMVVTTNPKLCALVETISGSLPHLVMSGAQSTLDTINSLGRKISSLKKENGDGESIHNEDYKNVVDEDVDKEVDLDAEYEQKLYEVFPELVQNIEHASESQATNTTDMVSPDTGRLTINESSNDYTIGTDQTQR